MLVLLMGVHCASSSAQIIYVDANTPDNNDGSSWALAHKYLQDALAVAQAGTDIWVAKGTYKPDRGGGNTPGKRTATFVLEDGVGIYGGFPAGGGTWASRKPNANETILSGDLNGDDANVTGPSDLQNDLYRAENSYNVIRAAYVGSTAIIDGFIIKAGNANYSSSHTFKCGSGMYNYSASPTVYNCKFIGNSAILSGGAMMNDEQSCPMVANCTFIWNYAGVGAGMASDKESSQLVTNGRFIANLADANGGGMFISGPNDTNLTNCVFISNQGTDGGAILNRTYPTITNCTFSGNLADANGGGIYSEDGNCPTLANCVFWGNTDANGCVESSQIYGDTPVINYCCVQGWTGDLGGTGNIGSNPLLADPNGPDDIVGTEDDDTHLSPGSPCIDAGDNTAVPPDTADLDGDGNTTEPTPWDFDSHPRFVDGDCNDTNIVDMGADEFPYVGDFNFSGFVNFDDFAIFALAWFTEPGDAQWNPACDISIPADNFIDMLDLQVLVENWLAGH